MMNRLWIAILRGPPGSGKTTLANHIIDFFGREKLNDGQMFYISRDLIRERFANKHGLRYETTFKHSHANTRIRDKFMHEINVAMNYPLLGSNRIIIIDSTFSKLADMKNIFRMCRLHKLEKTKYWGFRPRVRLFNFESVKNNHRNVPKPKLDEIKSSLKATDEYMRKHIKSKEIVEIK